MQEPQAVIDSPPAPQQAPDWELIRSLYIQGLTPSAISARTGVKRSTISVRATRGSWKATAAKTSSVLKLSQLGTPDNPTEDANDSLSESNRRALARILARSIDQIEQMPIPNGKAALKLNRDLEPVVRSCKTVHSWADGEQQSIVRIGVMNTCVVASPSSTPPTPEVIDVETTTKEACLIPKPEQITDKAQPLLPGGESQLEGGIKNFLGSENFQKLENSSENPMDYEI